MREKLRALAISLGADVCGFARAGDFGDAPEGFRPRDIWNGCESVMAVGLALPRGAYLAQSRLVYTRYNHLLIERIDALLLELSRAVEREACAAAMPLPCDNPYDDYDPATRTGRGMLSMKHAAVLAGLGRLGKSTLLLNQAYGNRLTIGAILLDIPLEADPPAAELCLHGCRLCVDACPAGAIADGAVAQAKCRAVAYGKNARGFDVTDCFVCRAACPVRFGRGA